MDYTSRLRAIIDRIAGDQVLPTGVTLAGGDLLDTPATFHSHTGGNPAAGSAGGSIAPRKQPPAHGIHGPQWAADEIERADRQDRVRRGE